MVNSTAGIAIGIDGCPAGWLCVVHTAQEWNAWIEPDLRAVVERADRRALIGIDMPIGFPAAGLRTCDQDARNALGHRRSSVFHAPARSALAATTHAEACVLNRAVGNKGISIQAFHLFPKMREVDELLQSDVALRERVVEVHPELSFTTWNGRPMEHRKKSREGRSERTALIDRKWDGLVGQLRVQLGRGGYGEDDLLDAIAAVWSTLRYSKDECRRLPATAPIDDHGVRMQIIA